MFKKLFAKKEPVLPVPGEFYLYLDASVVTTTGRYSVKLLEGEPLWEVIEEKPWGTYTSWAKVKYLQKIGSVAEGLNAPGLNPGGSQGSVSSNLTASSISRV